MPHDNSNNQSGSTMNIKTIIVVIIFFFCPLTIAVAEETAIPKQEENVLNMSEEIRDVVYLKNGSIIRGTILEIIPDSTIRIQTGDGNVFVYPMGDVEKIVKEDTQTLSGGSSQMESRTARGSKTQLGALIGYGTEDWYNVGLGLRIGATFPSGVYFGGTFIYHLGKSQDFSFNTGFGSVSYSLKVNTLYVGPELGYDAQASENFIVRPYISFGYFSLMASVGGSGNSGSDSEGRFYIAPGMMFNVLASQVAMIGLDGRYVIVTGEGGSDVSAFGIFLSLGIIL